MLLRSSTVFVLMASLSACGERSSEPAPTPSANAAAAPLRQAVVTANGGVVYRWADGDWMVRVQLDVHNGTARSLTIERSEFGCNPSLTPWPDASTFPERATIEPGQRASGTIAWYAPGSGPAPTSISVSREQWTQVVSLAEVPLPPAAGTVERVTGRVDARFGAEAVTWRHSDGDHVVRVPVELTNGTNVALSVPASYFRAVLAGAEGGGWSEATTLADPLELAPGARVEGFVAWYWDGEGPVPTQVTARLGAASAPLTQATVTVVPRR